MKRNKLVRYIEKLMDEDILVSLNIVDEVKNTFIENVTYDSRKVRNNTLFI